MGMKGLTPGSLVIGRGRLRVQIGSRRKVEGMLGEHRVSSKDFERDQRLKEDRSDISIVEFRLK